MDITNDNGSITRVSDDMVEEILRIYFNTMLPLPNIAETVGLSTYVVGRVIVNFHEADPAKYIEMDIANDNGSIVSIEKGSISNG